MIELDDKKLSFKDLLKRLYRYEQTSFFLWISILFFFFNNIMIVLFILLPNINILGFGDFFFFLIIMFGLISIMIISLIIVNKSSNRAVFLTASIIEAIIENLSSMNMFESENEKTILEENLKSLYIFQKIHDYKYCLIVMGSIIEFLLIRYCKKNNIDPEPYISPNGNIIPATKKRFCNYIQSAIKYDILGQKNSWYLVQNNLRNFRNYIHISKEIQEEEIDHDWYTSTKGVFDRIIRNFK